MILCGGRKLRQSIPSGNANQSDDSVKISVIIVSYNESAYISQAIDSVFEQQHQHPFEIIIGDGSTDESPEIIARYEQEHSDVVRSFIVDRGNPKDVIPSVRVSNVLKRAFSMSRGEYLCIFSADDMLGETNRFSRQGFTSVSLGAYDTAAIKSDGTLWTCGFNINGNLGDGTTETHFSLVSIGGELAAGVAVASFGNGCSSATKADGSLWTWGSNKYGQLGDGSGNDQHTPVKVMDGVALDMPAPRPASPFFDVPAGAWFAGVTSRAASLGVLNGYPNGNFGPNDRITRGQVAVALWKMANQPAGARDFPDVHEGDYFRDAVRWAGSNGIVSGYGNGNFGPKDNVTREQLAAMLANYAQNVGKQQVTGSVADYDSMADKTSVSPWAQTAVGWCFNNGILSGSGGQLRPQGNASRAEAAKMVVFLHDMPA